MNCAQSKAIRLYRKNHGTYQQNTKRIGVLILARQKNFRKHAEVVSAGAFCSFALFGTCLLLYVSGQLVGGQSERRKYVPIIYKHAAKVDARLACIELRVPDPFECIYDRLQAAQDQARAEQDLSAQQLAAVSSLASALIAFFAMIITTVGVWFVKRTLDETRKAVEDTGIATLAMKEQNRIAETTAMQQLRAYLILDEPVFNPILDLDGKLKQLVIYFRMSNSGETPATVTCAARAIFVLPKNATMPTPKNDSSKVLHVCVGKSTPQIFTKTVISRENLIDLRKKGLWIYIILHITYKDIFNNEHIFTHAIKFSLGMHPADYEKTGAGWASSANIHWESVFNFGQAT